MAKTQQTLGIRTTFRLEQVEGLEIGFHLLLRPSPSRRRKRTGVRLKLSRSACFAISGFEDNISWVIEDEFGSSENELARGKYRHAV
jgi:hypothetical protein